MGLFLTDGLCPAAVNKFNDENAYHRVFRSCITDNIDPSMFKDLYTAGKGAGSQNPRVLMAMLIFKEAKGMTDLELEHSMQFDPCTRYAIGLDDNVTKLPCLKTYTNFVKRMRDYDEAGGKDGQMFADRVFESVNSKLAERFGVKGYDVRIDSTLFGTNIGYCSRFRIVSDALGKFAKSKDFEKIEASDIRERISAAVLGNPVRVEYDSTRAEVSKKMLEIGTLMHKVISVLGDDVDGTFRRVFSDQFVVSEGIDGKAVVSIKPGKQMLSDSVQNVNDPDAGYRKKYDPKRGLCLQVAEAFSSDPREVNLITACLVTPINKPDNECYQPLIEQSARVTGSLPKNSYQDGAYWSAENAVYGDGKIKPCFTALSGSIPSHAFTRGEDGKPMVTCLATGKVVPLLPVKTRKDGSEEKFKFQYDTDEKGKPKYRTMTTGEIDAAILRESFRHSPGTEKKKRNNVEATISATVCNLDGDKTKYRGIWRNQLYFSCHCLGINARRIELHVSKKSRKGKAQGAA